MSYYRGSVKDARTSALRTFFNSIINVSIVMEHRVIQDNSGGLGAGKATRNTCRKATPSPLQEKQHSYLK